MKKGHDRTDDARRDRAQALAIAALSFLADDPDRLGAFLAAAGIVPEALREAASQPEFLVGVLDHMSGDESLVIEFAGHAGIEPGEIERARASLGGVWERDIP